MECRLTIEIGKCINVFAVERLYSGFDDVLGCIMVFYDLSKFMVWVFQRLP